MWVTCYTDASWSRRRGGGWAVWLRSEAGRLVRHGACPPFVRDSVEAELAAIYAGLYLATRVWGDRVAGILVCSDCLGALALVAPAAPSSSKPGTRRLQRRIRALAGETGIQVTTRWVKGHRSPSLGISAYVNHQCDRLARKGRVRSP